MRTNKMALPILACAALLLGVPSSAEAQDRGAAGANPERPAPDETPKAELPTGVVLVPGAGSKELYQRAKRWFVSEFRDARDVIQIDDSEGFELVAKGNVRFTPSKPVHQPCVSGHLTFELHFKAKEGRYRALVKRWTHSAAGSPKCTLPLHINDVFGDNASMTTSWVDQVRPEMRALARRSERELLQALRTKLNSPGVLESDDW